MEKTKENKVKITILLAIAIIIAITISVILTKTELITQITEKWKAEGETEYTYNNPYIPDGFYHIDGDWDTGYIIEEIATGNQFVWIPVDGTTVKLERKNYSVTDVKMSECTEELDDIFAESVENYGGYYVARYEAGVPKNSDFDTEDDMDSTGKPVSKKESKVWNNISYANAKSSAEQMYATKPEITSSLMSSYAYDTMLTWLEASGYNVETDSSTWGNYSNNPKSNNVVETSGKSNTWVANNIYDLAGNVSEWTTEKNGSNYIYRGGSYYNEGNITPAGIREVGNEYKASNTIGFRTIIYKTGESTIEGYNEPYIPIGFTHTEGEWNNGFVIKENAKDNEFVWIPVDGYNLNLDRSEFEKTFIKMGKTTDDLELRYKLSVYAYGGYYVSRYEAGVESTSGNNVGIPVSKKGATIWTNISQENAKASAEKMYDANIQINSRLMNSYAYDTMLTWLKTTDYSLNTYNVDTDSTSWGNYRNNGSSTLTKQLAGSNEQWKANNIYDIAGNVWEWTTETYNKEKVVRGGDYLSNGDILPAGVREHAVQTSAFDYTGYRILMYKDVAELEGPKEPTVEVASGTEGNNGWYKSDVDVKVIAGYSGIGVDKVTYRVQGLTRTAGKIGTQTYSANSTVDISEKTIESGSTLPITADGEFTITAYTYDALGNKSEAGTLELKRDTTAPTYSSVTVSDRTSSQFTVKVNGVTDTASGAKTYRYYANGTLKATTNYSTYIITGLTDGISYSVYVEIEDSAGNVTKTDTVIALYGYNRPIVPTGFTHTEGAWNTGFVIKDTSGNEFVWVPVDGSEVTLGRYEFTSTSHSTVSSTYKENTDTNFTASVNKYGGYYIARYEAGMPNGATLATNATARNITGVPVSKAGVYPWTYINYENAVKNSISMGNSYSNASTNLVSGTAWDTALLFIQKYATNGGTSITSTSIGSRPTAVSKVSVTGNKSNDILLNIGDLAGNVREYTTEYLNSGGTLVHRGGFYMNVSTAKYMAAKGRLQSGSTTTTSGALGFRVVLWVDP